MAPETPITPEPIKLAPLHLRLFALLLDYFFIVTALNLGDQLTLGEHWDLRAVSASTSTGYVYWAGGLITLFLIKDGLGGRSLGKWVAGIAVRRVSHPESGATLIQSITRNLALVLLPVEGYLVFADPQCRRLGDRWSGTVVIVPDRVAPLPRRLLGLSSLVLAVLVIAILVGPWNMRRTAAYQHALRVILTHPDLPAQVGADYAIEESTLFNLHPPPQGGNASVEFKVKGSAGVRTGLIELVLDPNRMQWVLESFTLLSGEPGAGGSPQLEVEDAPPPPARD
ncbi:MAG: RDD family protein [SAR324 cluster bacterium]|nr:RDD family protein [SAR324 cluster bacterium]